MQQPSQYTIYQGGRDVRREPPPYPGYSRGFQQTAGYRQSYASSETGSTDMSLSSCENLSTSMRQDPQGEETHHPGILSSPIDMAHPYMHQQYIQGSPTAMEVKAANSRSFYVTGSVPNQIDDMNLAGSYSTTPQMQSYGNLGHSIGDVGGGQGIIMPPPPMTDQQQQQFVQETQRYNTNQTDSSALHQPVQQAYNTNQYYTQGTNQNTQMYMTPPTNNQQPAHLHHQQQHEQHYSNLPVNNPASQPPQHYDNLQPGVTNATTTTPSPQSASKQDPFKRWQHYYVNQKTQLQYRFLQQQPGEQPGEQPVNQGSANNQKYESMVQGHYGESQGQSNEVQGHQHPQQQPYVNDENRSASRNNTANITSGSMIARLRQEFSNTQTNQNVAGQHGTQTDQNTSVSNVRATNERIRSATPDFLTERPLAVKQLPIRPSSANSKQRNQDRQQLSFSQIKAQKLNKQKSDSEMSGGENSSSQEVVDNNANKILPPMKLNPGLVNTSEPGSRLDSIQSSINPTAAILVQSPREQLQNQNQSKSLKSAPSLNRTRPRTASPQRSKTVLSPTNVYPGGSESDSSTIVTAPSDNTRKEMRRSYEMLDRLSSSHNDSRPDLSSSQPDLSHLVGGLSIHSSNGHQQGLSSSSSATPTSTSQLKHDKPFRGSSSDDSQDSNRSKSNELDHAAIATRATQMVERLSEENRSLRQELEGYYSKVCRLQKFECEIQKVTDNYQALVKHTTKRENLDKVMRLRLETEVKRLRENNRDLKDQLEKALSRMDASGVYHLAGDAELKRDLKEKDSIITKLISQNREGYKLRDKLEAELITQKDRYETSKNHIEILESTLKSSQKDKMKLEDQISQAQYNTEKLEKTQHVLTQLKAATEKRENIEQKLRNKLEEEVRTLKTTKFGVVGKASDTDEGISSDYESPSSRWQSMSRQMQGKDQEILKLQALVAHYEQKFIEEAAMRQLAVDVASVPKDAKIAALEVNSHETERLIDEAKTDRLKHLEELYTSSKKAAGFEAKVKTLTAQLAEKEAMIQVLQKQSLSLSRTSSVNSLFGSPLHSPHQSLTATPPPIGGSSCSRPCGGLSVPISPVLQHRDMTKLAIHSKSNSEGAVLDLTTTTTSTPSPGCKSLTASIRSTCSTTPTTGTPPMRSKMAKTGSMKNNKSLRQVLAAQAKLFQSWQTEQPDDLTKECWQV